MYTGGKGEGRNKLRNSPLLNEDLNRVNRSRVRHAWRAVGKGGGAEPWRHTQTVEAEGERGGSVILAITTCVDDAPHLQTLTFVTWELVYDSLVKKKRCSAVVPVLPGMT